ncbi:MAG TPA: hypothetical protein VFK05_11060 [Polyangiaceae bacterium]|nr:hypothetical protein [Polyangiaceae bacterium]
MNSDTSREDVQLVLRVRSGDAAAQELFLRRITEVVRLRVGRVLVRAARRRAHADLRRRELLDLMQDVFVVLLDREARVLAAWDSERGLSLEGFVGLVAEREALAFLRSGRRSAWAEYPSDDLLNDVVADASPELQTAAKEQLSQLLDFLYERLSPQGALLFEALYVSHSPVEEICARFSMTPVAVYSFRTRLKRLVAGFRVNLQESFEEVAAPTASAASESAE